MIARIKIPEQPITLSNLETLQRTVNNVRAKAPSDQYHYGELPEGKTKEYVLKEKHDKALSNIEALIFSDYHSEYVVDVMLLMSNCPFVKFEVLESVISTSSHTPEILIHKFYEMSEKLNKTVDTFNSRCNVNIGGNTMIQFNTVKVQTDFCTEALQDELDNGWRIIACCVQPDGRRPDYVLGRTDIKE